MTIFWRRSPVSSVTRASGTTEFTHFSISSLLLAIRMYHYELYLDSKLISPEMKVERDGY